MVSQPPLVIEKIFDYATVISLTRGSFFSFQVSIFITKSNMHCLNYSRKQYSPLSPSSPEESDSPPERVNIDLMQELRHVIFPNSPPVDRTVRISLIYTCYVEMYGKLYNKHKFENISIMK